MKEMDKKLRCRNTLWAVQNKDDNDIMIVCEYREEAREVVRKNNSSPSYNGKLKVVRLMAAPEKVARRRVTTKSTGGKAKKNGSNQLSLGF